jgi:hypothetical protein
MRFFYFIHRIEDALLRKLPDILSELAEHGDIEASIRKYHINQIGGKKYSSRNPIMDPIFIEVIGFLKYLNQEKGYSYKELSEKVTFVTKDHAFVYASDETIYHLAPWSKKLDKIFPSVESIQFMSMRDAFYHPFFLFVEWLSNKYGTITTKSLVNESSSLDTIWPYKDKLHTLSRVHASSPEKAGDFIVPFYKWNDQKVVQLILDFAKEKVSSEIMIKKSFWCAGESIRPLSLKKKLHPDTLTNISRDYFFWGWDFSWIIITVLYKIKKEYRIYYILQNWIPKVYSIKERTNKISRRKILEQTNFKIYKNIPVKWKYVGKNFLEGNHSHLKDTVDALIVNIWYTTWILEIIETEENEIFVMEVNYLWCSLVFPGEDAHNMATYNTDIHHYLFS